MRMAPHLLGSQNNLHAPRFSYLKKKKKKEELSTNNKTCVKSKDREIRTEEGDNQLYIH